MRDQRDQEGGLARRAGGFGGREPPIVDGRQQGVAALPREERREAVDGGVGEVERQIGRAERGGGEAGEDGGRLVDLREDGRVPARVGVGRARPREVRARVGRVQREEEPFEEPFGGERRVVHFV